MADRAVENFEIFPWNDNFESGMEKIDAQHKQLVHLLNKLAAHLAHQSDPIELNQVFGELAAYADYHFKTEEDIWDPCFKDDPWCLEHHRTHASFMVEVGRLKEEEKHKPLDAVIEDILKFLTHWLAYHILDSDKRMAKTVLAVESGLTLEQAKQHADKEMSGSMKLLIDTVLTMYDSLTSRTFDLMKEKNRRMRAEQALQESEIQEKSFSDAVMNLAPGMLYLVDEKLQLIRWNKKLSTLSAYSDEELRQKNILDFFENEFHARVLEDAHAVLADDKAEFEGRLLTKDGKLIPCLFHSVKLEIDGIDYISGIGIDISDRKRAEEALLKSQEQFFQAQKMEAVGTLVGGIAHDFNNMLAGITGNLYLAKRRTQHLPEVVQKLSDVEALSFRASDMIQQLLAFSRKGEVAMKTIPLTPFIKETLKFLKTSIPENIEVRRDISNELMLVKGNATQLHQVLMNLINNARDAIEQEEHPSITISLERFQPDSNFLAQREFFHAGAYAHLTVADNGHGITTQELPHLFEPFFTTKAKGKGTGLGLSMVYGSIKSHDGYIDVESEAGEGTRFHIYLPITQTPEHKSMPSSEHVIGGKGERILFVDDEEVVRNSNRKILKSINYKVVEACDGEQAIEVFATSPNDINLIIMDIVMPKLGGIEAVEQIRKIRPDIKVIFSTGYDKHEALNNHHELVVSKPLNIPALSATIRSVLDS